MVALKSHYAKHHSLFVSLLYIFLLVFCPHLIYTKPCWIWLWVLTMSYVTMSYVTMSYVAFSSQPAIQKAWMMMNLSKRCTRWSGKSSVKCVKKYSRRSPTSNRIRSGVGTLIRWDCIPCVCGIHPTVVWYGGGEGLPWLFALLFVPNVVGFFPVPQLYTVWIKLNARQMSAKEPVGK